jgi:glucosamine 6-phosphate synthetase-like amidotransferase/phosphosugar isomerase protein
VAIVNGPGSVIARESNFVLQTLAGAEIRIASTKAFTRN